MRSPVVERLEQLGYAETPDIDPVFVDQLEFRLRAAAPDNEPAHDWRRPLIAASAAFAVVIAVLAFSVFANRADDVQSVQLTAAIGTTVELPNGRVVPGVPGLEVPDGAVIRTDEGGSATVAGVTLGPNEEAVVVGRTVRPVDRQPEVPVTTTQVPRATTTIARPTTSAPPTTLVETRPEPTEVRPTPTTEAVQPDRTTPPPPASTTTPTSTVRTRPEEGERSR